MLHTNELRIGGAAIQRDPIFTSSPPDVVLQQDREQAVVGVLADAPSSLRSSLSATGPDS